MAETFNCPSCGAPLNYNAETQKGQGTIPCPYCGESVIVPEELRELSSPQVFVTIQPDTGQSRPTQARGLRGCVVISLLVAVVAAVGTFWVVNSARQAALQAVSAAVGVPTGDPVMSIRTQVAPLMAQVTEAVAQVTEQARPTLTLTPTPTLDLTATAAVIAQTRTAQEALMRQQQNWPAVVQEKFTSNQRNWNTGQDNNNLAVEDLAISGGKYTWKMTSKKSMGSFSFPDMPEQTDLFVSVDLLMSTSTPNAADQAGIIFRDAVKEQSFYFFGVNPQGTYSLTYYDGSEWSDLIPTAETTQLKPGQVNHLAVSMQGSQILLMINNAVVDGFEDTRAASGIAGLGINLPSPGEDGTFVFSNFTVRAPGKK